MTIRSALRSRAALGVLLACSAGAADAAARKGRAPPRPSALEQKVERLTAAVQALDARLEAETSARQAVEAQVEAAKAEAAASRAEAQAARSQLANQIQTIPGVVDAAVETRTRNPASLRYKGVTITPGGFLAAESIYRSKNEASDISSSFSRIPFANSPLAHTKELRLSARQTRLSALVQGDLNPSTHAAFYGEFDFQAAAQTANSVESNSYNPRIRHLYGTIDWDDLGLHLLAGQAWSLVTLNGKGVTPRNELPPPLIDGQYLPGFAWARQPQIRLVKDWDKAIWAAVSLENPQTSFSSPATGIASTANGISVLSVTPGISGFDSGNNLSLNNLPDVVGKLAYEPEIGGGRPLHLEAFGVWRRFDARIAAAPGNALGAPPGNHRAKAHGGGVGGSATASVLSGRLDLQASAMTGRGIGRYGAAQLPDVTLRPDGTLAPVRQFIYLAGATWHATPNLDVYLFGGEERQRRRFFDTPTGHFGLGNPAANFTALGCRTEGGVCAPNLRRVSQITAGVWRKAYTGAYGQVRVGLQYSHTQLRGFSGAAGFAPKTSDDMIFTSFRYYLP
jgi:hypothetical protein